MSTTPETNPNHDEEIIAEMERSIAAGTELEGFHRVPGRVSRNLSVTYAIRLSPDEYRDLNEAAKSRGMTLAEFMRSASHAVLTGELDVEKAALLGKARDAARDLAETLGRI